MQDKRIDRKFDTWTVKSDTGKEYTFEVRYDKGETAELPVRFYVYTDKPVAVHVEDGNLEELRKKLLHTVNAQTNAKWERYLVVHINDYRHSYANEKLPCAGVEFHTTDVLIGTDPKGNKFWKPDERTKTVYEGTPAEDRYGEGRLAGGGVRLLVPDTPDNQAILVMLQGLIDDFTEYVKDMFDPNMFRNDNGPGKLQSLVHCMRQMVPKAPPKEKRKGAWRD